MELQWKCRARVVGYIDLALSVLELIVAVVLVTLGVVATVAMTDEEVKKNVAQMTNGKVSEADFKVVAWLMWLAIGIYTIGVVAEMWAAIKLVKATEVTVDLSQSLNRAVTWRIVAIIFLIIAVFFNIVLMNIIILVIDIVVRGIMLFVVTKYIMELNEAAGGGGSMFSPKV